MAQEKEGVKIEEHGEGTPPPPTFAGRLRLAEFKFNGGPAAVVQQVRRSPRQVRTPSLATGRPGGGVPTSSGASPVPVPLPAPSSPGTRNPGTRIRSATSTPSKKRQMKSEEEDNQETQQNTTNLLSPGWHKRPKLTRSKSSSSSKPPSPSKSSSGYAPPSKYAHLPQVLPDALAPNLLILFVGLNPGVETAITGHAYAHPTNLFWKLLHSSGITPDRLCSAFEDREMPRLYGLGLTNIVGRPSRNGSELSKKEMDAGVDVLEKKVRTYRPEVVCIVGKSIWESLWRVRHGRGIKKDEFRYGWQEERENMGVVGAEGQPEEEKVVEEVDYGAGDWKGAKVFVASSTSGLAATLSRQEKQRIWSELGEWAQKRRAERLEEKKTKAKVEEGDV